MCMLLLDLVGLFAVIDSEAFSVSICNRIYTVRQKNALMLKLHFLLTIYRDSDMSRSILIIFRTSS